MATFDGTLDDRTVKLTRGMTEAMSNSAESTSLTSSRSIRTSILVSRATIPRRATSVVDLYMRGLESGDEFGAAACCIDRNGLLRVPSDRRCLAPSGRQAPRDGGRRRDARAAPVYESFARRI